MGADIPEGWLDGLRHFVQTFPRTLDEVDAVVTRNKKDYKDPELPILDAAECVQWVES